jgi:IS5 family transposase
VDPEVLIQMLVVGYLYGITAERRLCQEVQLNLAYRWFCGLWLEDKVPDHSTLTKNRYGRFTDCRACALKAQCTRTRYRVAHRHWDQDYLEQAQAARQTQSWKISQRFRKFIEHLFDEAKKLMGLRRARRRGLEQVREQCLVTATVQNIKRIVKALERGSPRPRAAFGNIRCPARISVAFPYSLRPQTIIQTALSPLERPNIINAITWRLLSIGT